MRWIKEDEAQERFAELLEEVERGETVDIVRKGKQVARLIPGENERLVEDPEEAKKRKRADVERFLEWRRARKPRGITLEEALEWRHASE